MNGTFDFNGYSEGIDGLSGTGTVTNSNSSSASVMTMGYVSGGQTGGTITFPGVIADGAGSMGLAVSGATFIVTGTRNAYSGGTTIYSGLLQIGDGSTSPGSLPGNVVINTRRPAP